MIKSQLVQRIAERNPHLYQRDVEHIVSAILDEIATALARGDRVELRGFGAFSVKNRPARVSRNPRRTLILMRDFNQITRLEIKGLFMLSTAIMIFALKSTGG